MPYFFPFGKKKVDPSVSILILLFLIVFIPYEIYRTVKKWTQKTEIPTEIEIQGDDLLKVNNQIWMRTNLNIPDLGAECYDHQEEFCQTHGKLYTWEAAENACQTLGQNWYLPTDQDWQDLIEAVGGKYEDLYGIGFSLSGFKSLEGFQNLGTSGVYWSRTEFDLHQAWSFAFSRDGFVPKKGHKSLLGSCRCVQYVN